jgi:SAM-dependent methyltransferase
MQNADLPIPEPDCLAGRKLYGNDFDADQLRTWYAAEEYGYYDLYGAAGTNAGDKFPYRAINRADAAALRSRSYASCLVLGCAEGEDLVALDLDIGQIIAIEPAERFWQEAIHGIPATFRKPTLDGSIDLPDGSVNLVVALNVLHHIANVEAVVRELGRIVAPGGAMLIREPIASMGDFRGPRHGLTRCERGIPVALMRRFIDQTGLSLRRPIYRNTPGLPELAAKLGKAAFNLPLLVACDRVISAVTRFNDRYWRRSTLAKLAPRTATYIATRPR